MYSINDLINFCLETNRDLFIPTQQDRYYGRDDNYRKKHEYKFDIALSLDAYDYQYYDMSKDSSLAQLKRELEKFSKVTNKYIIMHDTTIDDYKGETIRSGWNAEVQSRQTGFPVDEINKGLLPAITEFVESNPNWRIREKFDNNNGLTVLERIP